MDINTWSGLAVWTLILICVVAGAIVVLYDWLKELFATLGGKHDLEG